MELGVNAYEIIRQKEDKVRAVIPFNSSRKRACTILENPLDSSKISMYVKVAPEIVIEYCDKYYDNKGNAVDLDSKKKY